MSMNEIEHQLKLSYQQLDENRKPDGTIWVEAPPAIPFVGDGYGQDGRCKLLVYGSAENLNFDRTGQLTYFRNREQFDGWKNNSFFPPIHMTPISDGTLLTLARYLLHVFKQEPFSVEPEAFLQQIAVGNYGKFSLRGDSNEDYANKPMLLKDSDQYVLADLELLEPDMVILPKTIHWSRFKTLLKERVGHEPKEVWRIYQTNTRATTHAKRELDKAREVSRPERPEWVERWLKQIVVSKQGFMAHQLDWVDLKVDQEGSDEKPAWHIRYPMA